MTGLQTTNDHHAGQTQPDIAATLDDDSCEIPHRPNRPMRVTLWPAYSLLACARDEH